MLRPRSALDVEARKADLGLGLGLMDIGLGLVGIWSGGLAKKKTNRPK